MRGLVPGQYHWQARVVDVGGNASDWLEAGGNPTAAADFTILAPTLAPTLRIDGGLSSSHAQNQTFAFTGANYTPNSTVTRYLQPPGGIAQVLTPTLPADGAGNIAWSFSPSCSTATGTYTLWAVDDATGRTSNTVSETVTANPACSPPTLRIDGGLSSSRPQRFLRLRPDGRGSREARAPKITTCDAPPAWKFGGPARGTPRWAQTRGPAFAMWKT